MTFTVSTINAGVMRLAVEGELDAVTVPDLRKEIDKLAAAAPKRVEIDLSSLRMVDSSGVGAIVSLYKRVRGSGRRSRRDRTSLTSRWPSSGSCASIA